jgi:membrane associated rhomboid family serine protease
MTEGKRDSRFDGFVVVAAMAALMWVVEVVNALDHYDLNQYGIEPRDADGLVGVVASPFLHGSWGHLIGNTLPFVVMGCAVALKGAGRVIAVTVIVGLVAGLGTWLVSPDNTITVGASGIVFGYATYLLCQGFFDREFLGIFIGLVVAALWGTALLSSLAPQPGVSWQGHFFGAVGGVIAAAALKRERERAAAGVQAAI